MAVIKLERLCVACRGMIPPTEGAEIMTISPAKLLYDEKSGVLKGKIDAKLKLAMCPECSKKFYEIVESQQKKGYRVL